MQSKLELQCSPTLHARQSDAAAVDVTLLRVLAMIEALVLDAGQGQQIAGVRDAVAVAQAPLAVWTHRADPSPAVGVGLGAVLTAIRALIRRARERRRVAGVRVAVVVLQTVLADCAR